MICEEEEYEKYHAEGKNIVYLGNKKVNIQEVDKYFWSKECKIEQIIKCIARKVDIDVPIILCRYYKKLDIILFMVELKKRFCRDGYNLYAASNKIEGVLYDLEYIPEEMCTKNNMDNIHNFLYWQTYYNQSDILFIGIDSKNEVVSNFYSLDVDVVINIDSLENGAEIELLYGRKLVCKEKVEVIKYREVEGVYKKMLVIMEKENE